MPRRSQTTMLREEIARLELQLQQLQSLHRVGVALASTMKPVEIMRLVLAEVMTLTSAACATIFLRDQQLQKLVPQLTLGVGPRPPSIDLVSGDDLLVQAAHTSCICQSDADATGIDDPCRMAVPLVSGDEVLGVIEVCAQRSVCYDEHVTDLLATMAAQAAQVLRHASTHEELEQHYREMSLLYEIQQEIASTFDYNTVLKLIVERTKRLLNGNECSIRLVIQRDSTKYFRVVATTVSQWSGPEELPFEQSLIEGQVLTGNTLYVEDVRNDPRFSPQDAAVKLGMVSMLCAPLVARRRVIGSIRLYTDDRREFSISDRKMLLAVAGQAATAIENARLYRQIESKNRQLSESYEALRRTQKELIKKERLAALGEMAATVAHEIRNPLTSIRGFAQRIARRNCQGSDKRLGEYTEIIMEEVDRLNKFIMDVLDFARHVKPAFERVNINQVLSEVLTLMRDEFLNQRIVVVPDFDMTLRETVVDESLLKQMLLNILQNARQALESKGIIMIKTQNSGNFIRIRVTDNGHGIARENLQKIWSPFFSTKAQGTGLGLALAQRISDDHHGRIFIRSRVNYGTIVDIFLPCVASEEELLKLGQPPPATPPAASNGAAT